MFKYISVSEQLIKERAKNAKNEQDNARNAANIDYIAMMTDVELADEEETNDEQEI